jgi:endonuclease III
MAPRKTPAPAAAGPIAAPVTAVVPAKRAGAPKRPAAGAGPATAAKAASKSNSKSKAKPPGKPPGRRAGSPKALPPDEVREVFARFQAALPEPKGELEHVNPFTLLVAVVLSAQATDAGVNRATRSLFQAADTPEKMLALGEDRVREAIKTIGLFRNKAKNVVALSRRLVEEHGGEVPREREALESLPGVGRKTANVVLNTAFAEPTIAVDTHLFRVSNRIPLAPGATPLAVEQGLLKVVPEEYLLHAHHWLILHGRYVCKARKPDCPRCVIADLCRYEPKTRV